MGGWYESEEKEKEGGAKRRFEAGTDSLMKIILISKVNHSVFTLELPQFCT